MGRANGDFSACTGLQALRKWRGMCNTFLVALVCVWSILAVDIFKQPLWAQIGLEMHKPPDSRSWDSKKNCQHCVDIQENHISRWFPRGWNNQGGCDQTGEECPQWGGGASKWGQPPSGSTPYLLLQLPFGWVWGLLAMAPPCPTIKEWE